MAATIASAAAAKSHILAQIGSAGARWSGHRRFTSLRITSFTFGFGQNYNNNNKITSFLKLKRKTKTFSDALFCTAQTEAVVIAAGEDDQPKPSQSLIKEAADQLDIRVGRILKAWRHEEADSLYVEEVDVGEPEPRLICSGLVEYVPLERLQGLGVVVLANLKPRNMRGVKSSGMLMAASDASHSMVELLVPPEGSIPGQRVWFGSNDQDDASPRPEPATPNQVQKKKMWELVQPHLKTDDSGVAMLGTGGHVMMTPAGSVKSPSLKNAKIS